MLPQARLILERLIAHRATEAHLIIIVLLHVLCQIAARCERLVALAADVGLLTRVNASMPDQVTDL